jgi:hypothetical protein
MILLLLRHAVLRVRYTNLNILNLRLNLDAHLYAFKSIFVKAREAQQRKRLVSLRSAGLAHDLLLR